VRRSLLSAAIAAAIAKKGSMKIPASADLFRVRFSFWVNGVKA
jgi:hypothetical protein